MRKILKYIIITALFVGFYLNPSLIDASIDFETVSPLFKQSEQIDRKAEFIQKVLRDLDETVKNGKTAEIVFDIQHIQDDELLSKSQLSEDDRNYLKNALIYAEQWRYDEAISMLEKIIVKHPNAHAVRYILAILYLDCNKLDKASEEITIILNVMPNFIKGRLLKIVIDAEKGDFVQAENNCQELLLESSNNAAYIYCVLGRVYFLEKKYELASLNLRKAIELNSKLYSLHLSLAYSMFLQGQKEESVAQLKTCINQYPEFLEARSCLVSIYLISKEREKAIEECKRWIELYPKDTRPHLLMISIYGYDEADISIEHAKLILDIDSDYYIIYEIISAIYSFKGEDENALAYAEKMVSLQPYNARGYYIQGNTYDDMHNLDKAEIYYKKALELEPLNSDIYVDLGWVCYERYLLDEAETYCKKAIEINPNNKEAHYYLGIIYRQGEKYEKALEEYKIAIQLDQKYALAYNSIGYVYHLQGNDDEAFKNINKAIELDPDFAMAYTHLGIVYSDRKDHENAIKYYKKALTLAGERSYVRSAALNNLAGSYVDKGMYDQAVEEYKKAITVNPNLAESYYGLASIYEDNLGMFNEAINNFKKAIELKPIMTLPLTLYSS